MFDVTIMGGPKKPVDIHEKVVLRSGIEFYKHRANGHSVQFWGSGKTGFVRTIQEAWWFEENDKIDQIKSALRKNVQLKDNGCYEWTGSVDKNGRGYMHIEKCFRSVHQAIADAYFFGKFLSEHRHESLRPFMACKDKTCCNPFHMKFFDTKEKEVVELYYVKQFRPCEEWFYCLPESGQRYFERFKKEYPHMY